MEVVIFRSVYVPALLVLPVRSLLGIISDLMGFVPDEVMSLNGYILAENPGTDSLVLS